MFLPSPTSTLFPYTTLFRSFVDSLEASGNAVDARDALGDGLVGDIEQQRHGNGGQHVLDVEAAAQPRLELDRSEEHTSELQSPCNLVCRLLLEKKNNVR